MKKLKIAFWILLLVFIGLVIGQNQGLFLAKQRLQLNLFFTDPFFTPELHVAVFFVAFFLLGLAVAYFFSLLERFKSRKIVKVLNADAAARNEELNALKAELAGVKSDSPAASAPADTPTEPETVPDQAGPEPETARSAEAVS